MLTPMAPDDDLSPLPGSGPRNGGRGAATTADDASLLRGLLEDGPNLPLPNRQKSGPTFSGLGTLDSDLDAENRSIPLSETHIDDILRNSQQVKASDVHLTIGLPPMYRIDGKVGPSRYEVVTPRDAQRLVYDILSSENIERFERTKELDFSYGVAGVGRFRFNVYRQKGNVGCAMRAIPQKIPTLDQLRLPSVLKDLTHKHSGLILVTGPTGSGKSTTIASMIDIINSERPVHIVTMEDPIEYIHSHKTAMVNQREIGQDTDSFHNAIRAVLREDPDVILVGEMRDKETIAAALTLSETGHLVFGTLHTRSAPSTIDRVVDVFPPDQQDQIKVQLSNSIQGVVSQQLLPMLGGGRVAAVEIMIATAAIRNLIREGKTHQIASSIETGSQFGMQPMDKVLADLFKNGMVSYDEALLRALDRENFVRLAKGQ
ncbi:MAG: type IV pilus twitching motility protein PilT [Capsulimonadales bacterium]|nr:type IV pilus twitching motility protein PilT [Capsulimonadales bacterium]